MLLSDALTNRINNEYRATANSLASFGFRGAFAFLGPLVGFGFDVWGMEVVLLGLGFFSAVLLLFVLCPLMYLVPDGRVFRKQQKDLDSLTVKET